MKVGPRLVAPAPSLLRPQPPELDSGRFARAIELEEWLRAVFIESRGPLHVEEHAVLDDAVVGALWTAESLKRKGKQVLATAEIPQPPQTGNAWARARYWQQLDDWFPDGRPDFLLTFWTETASLSDVRFCQVAHHELRHCAQALDKDGFPAWNRETGLPRWAVAPHDLEIFVSEVERFGIHDDVLASLIAAGQRAPRFGAEEISGVCGVCGAVAA